MISILLHHFQFDLAWDVYIIMPLEYIARWHHGVFRQALHWVWSSVGVGGGEGTSLNVL